MSSIYLKSANRNFNFKVKIRKRHLNLQLERYFRWLFFYPYNAEEGEKGGKKQEGKKTFVHYIAFGGVTFDTEEMEDELSASGFNTPREWAYLFSIGFYGKGKFVLEMKFNHILGKMREMGTNETKLFSSTSSLNFGYNFLYKNDMLALYPYIGSGFGKFSILLKL